MRQNFYKPKNTITVLAAIFCINANAQIYTITTVAGIGYTATSGGGPIGGTTSGDGGPALNAGLWFPQGIALDAQGNIYIADYQNYSRVRKVNANTGIITTIAGIIGTVGYNGDSIQGTSAALQGCADVAVDTQGNVYIADQWNNRIRKVNANTGIITTVVGNGTSGFSGDGGLATAAQLNHPTSVALDTQNNLYIADNGRIRKIDANTGIINTIAGNGTNTVNLGDGGQALVASISPADIVIDVQGNIFIADGGNCKIRKINANTGIITTIAGTTNSWNSSGDGGLATAAQLAFPCGVAVDATGNVFITDGISSSSNRVRKVDASTGIITTIAGTSSQSFYGDCGPATAAYLYCPWGIVVDAQGDIYVVDSGNCRIRKLTTKPLITATASQTAVCIGASTTLSVSGTSALNSMTSCVWNNGVTTASINVTPIVSASYVVTGNVATGLGNFCQNTVTLNIEVNPLPIVSVNNPTTLTCSGNAVILTPNGANTYSITGGSFTVNPNETNSSFTVTGTDDNGCQNTAVANFSLLPAPTLVIHASSNTICISETATLSSSGANTYTWSYPLNNTTWWVSTADISANPNVSTTYTVQGTGNNGCVGTTTLNLYVDACLGIDELEIKTAAVKIYPNPVDDVLNIESFETNEDLFVAFIDMYGKEVKQTKWQREINVQDLTKGIYILRISTASKEIVDQQKLIKE